MEEGLREEEGGKREEGVEEGGSKEGKGGGMRVGFRREQGGGK